ncbi:AraC family transcriptional regulator [Burkholderia gladioli]|uniref:AraC family transcriptional regulator n=1 Tax=Burkholderia gladioli TaxID=28095 RepID=UPI001641A751|nr:helix-turn-helix transcriptional regulator [Burkholderia gladioli]MBU9320025.1 helix-turn-helix transcriptional regulator [Burkholderia gladioli]
MPFLSGLASLDDWVDPDRVPRPVVTIGAADIVLEDHGGPAGDLRHRAAMEFHQHHKGELLLALRGVFTCEVDGGFWIVPPQSAIWIPGGIRHKFVSAGMLECYVVFVDPEAAGALPADCCVLATTPLLRELMIRSASLPVEYPDGGLAAHLMTLLLDELALAPAGKLHLPMPGDTRLRGIAEAIMARPADRGTIRVWARRAGLSERTLARRVTEQTGMSFGRWRQQLHLMLAVQWLANGMSIQQVADELGYESASTFVTMFRRTLGAPPARYMAEWGAGRR